ncbi:MAG: tetratricopeptide repeat protein [Saprospiraceae bacterium]|nr:tetratricopeptide repeat protein [Bacteroidia bacterium]NNE15827.1 tetratricopeptide repeat protein [Saprospiraceae bacterium]NNL91772.1 tetratricopeptide repeat protein [Saprospiraceae bacterium]
MKTFLLIILIFSINISWASDKKNPSLLFNEGNEYFESEEYEQAIAAYKSIANDGYHSAELNNNLGTAYFKIGKIAHAVLAFERAILLDPSDKKIKQNLELARSQVDSEIIEIPDFILVRIWRGLSSFLSPLQWILLQIIFAGLLLLSIYKWKFGKTENERLKGFVSSTPITLCLILFILAGFTSDNLAHQKESAILMQSVDLKTGPDARANEIENLPKGIKLKIRDQIDDWYKVQLINKEEGWVEKRVVEII